MLDIRYLISYVQYKSPSFIYTVYMYRPSGNVCSRHWGYMGHLLLFFYSFWRSNRSRSMLTILCDFVKKIGADPDVSGTCENTNSAYGVIRTTLNECKIQTISRPLQCLGNFIPIINIIYANLKKSRDSRFFVKLIKTIECRKFGPQERFFNCTYSYLFMFKHQALWAIQSPQITTDRTHNKVLGEMVF